MDGMVSRIAVGGAAIVGRAVQLERTPIGGDRKVECEDVERLVARDVRREVPEIAGFGLERIDGDPGMQPRQIEGEQPDMPANVDHHVARLEGDAIEPIGVGIELGEDEAERLRLRELLDLERDAADVDRVDADRKSTRLNSS